MRQSFIDKEKNWSCTMFGDNNNSPSNRNSIENQCINMVNHHVEYCILVEALNSSLKKGKNDKLYIKNALFWNFINQGYFTFQSMSIRRLMESMEKLITDMRKSKITREEFIGLHNLPYEYEEKLLERRSWEIENTVQIKKEDCDPLKPPEEFNNAEESKKCHAKFDKMSGKSEETRSKDDIILNSYWEKIRNKLDATDIKRFVDEFIAHANLNPDKVENLNKIHEDHVVDTDKIEECHRSIIGVVNKLLSDFWVGVGWVFLNIDKITRNISAPFSIDGIEGELYEFSKKKGEYLKGDDK